MTVQERITQANAELEIARKIRSHLPAKGFKRFVASIRIRKHLKKAQDALYPMMRPFRPIKTEQDFQKVLIGKLLFEIGKEQECSSFRLRLNRKSGRDLCRRTEGR